jgi:ketosteroid isomerase-like protein
VIEGVLDLSLVATLNARMATQTAAIPIHVRRQGQKVSCQNRTAAVERSNPDGRWRLAWAADRAQAAKSSARMTLSLALAD